MAAHEAKEETMCREPGCGLVFRKMETLQLHMRKDHLHEDEPFRCTERVSAQIGGREICSDECGCTFPTIGKLNVHKNRNHREPKIFCDLCPLSDVCDLATGQMDSSSDDQKEDAPLLAFSSWAELQAHKKTVHPPTCDICGRVCDSARAMKAHKEIEHVTLAERQRFRCSYPGCDRGFTKEGNLKVHFNSVHANIRNFVCGEYDLSNNAKTSNWDGHGCGVSFKTKNALGVTQSKYFGDRLPVVTISLVLTAVRVTSDYCDCPFDLAAV